MRPIKRVFYAASGPGDVIESHRYWKQQRQNSTEVCVTFSSQIEDFCREIGAEAYFISTHPRRDTLVDQSITLEHRPKALRRGARFHLAQVWYGIGLLKTALGFRADVALIDSGCTHFFVLTLFRLFGLRVVPILHNTLWPSGFPPTKPVARLVLWLDSLFWRWIPAAVIAVSPECGRQVDKVRKGACYPIHQTRAQYLREYFARIPPPPSHAQRPFRMMFVGRADRAKGVFDLLEIARKMEDHHPGLVRWELCGHGGDFQELKRRHEELQLRDTVNLRGWTSPEDQLGVYARTHACIVPTRSAFTEGLAMTAAEATLAGRPLLTNPVVPALEVLRPACVEARTDDVDSYLRGVLKLATDPGLYERLRAACCDMGSQFYDRELGLAAVLKRALATHL